MHVSVRTYMLECALARTHLVQIRRSNSNIALVARKMISTPTHVDVKDRFIGKDNNYN